MILDEALKKPRVTEEDVREKGHGAMGDVEATVLESDGTLSVIPEHQPPAWAITPEIEGVNS
ncbi:MAG: YetF domain-containing protein [Nitrososphaerales archaeon]